MSNERTRGAYERCGAKLRKRDGYCKQPAGNRTEHPGEGRCWLHGGKSPVWSGRYSSVKRTRLKDLLDHFQGDPKPLDLLEDLALLRSLVLDYLERYDEVTDALVAWHESFQSSERATKPVRVLDVADASRLIDRVGTMAKRIEEIRAENAVSKKDLSRVLEEYARAVRLYVQDPDTLNRIADAWSHIHL